MRVVFDTNIYVSALAIPGGVAERALQMAMEGAFALALSRPILDEVLGILSRKFARDAEELARAAIFLSSVAEHVVPAHRVRVLADLPDNRILECALAAAAYAIVTGDQEILSLGTWQGIEIVSLRQFVDRFGRQAREPRAAYRVERAARTEERPVELSSEQTAFLAKLLKVRPRPGARYGVQP